MTGTHALTITLADGGTYKIVGKGTLDGPLEITDTLTVHGKNRLPLTRRFFHRNIGRQEITDKPAA